MFGGGAGAAQDTTGVQGAIYDRPYVGALGRASVGGYAEANVGYQVHDGIAEGPSAEMRRFNLFVFAPIGERLRFTSELEFEHGTEEIALETALLDIEIRPELVVRAGVLLIPLGAFNQNHDSPRWDFVDRPLVSTAIIPSTLSEVGIGVHGRGYRGSSGLTYDLYLTNGLADGVLANDVGRTCLPCGRSEEAFEADHNGSPALSGRIAAIDRRFGELGVSFYTGVYNTFEREGLETDERRRTSIAAGDARLGLGRVDVRGEVAYAMIDVPGGLAELFGSRQWGIHLDAVVRVAAPSFFGRPAPLAAVLRVEAVDFNAGAFESTGRSIGDEQYALVAGLSFRPAPETVLLLNYRRQVDHDFEGNPAAHTGGVRLGFATYF